MRCITMECGEAFGSEVHAISSAATCGDLRWTPRGRHGSMPPVITPRSLMFVLPSRRLAALLGLALCAGNATAQQVIVDPAPFRKPAVFVVPDLPPQLLVEQLERIFDVHVDVDAQGLVARLASLEPDEPAFRPVLQKTLAFWLFYPKVDSERCVGVPSKAHVQLVYRRDQAPSAFVTFNPMAGLLGVRPPERVKAPPTPRYPELELRRGQQGRVYLLGEVLPDGQVSDTRLLLGVPSTPGFLDTATRHLRATLFAPGTAERRCVLTQYIFKIAS